jgi:hypothetical protein
MPILNIPGSAFDPYLLGDVMDPEGHAAKHGVTCRNCGATWPCPNRSRADHTPSLIPNGATVTTYEDLDRLVWCGDLSVVLDRDRRPWMLFVTEDGDGYAATVACPDDDIPALYNLEDLPTRGPLLVLFNGDHTTITASDDSTGEDR